jgi:DNA-binding NtrC family response regulator
MINVSVLLVMPPNRRGALLRKLETCSREVLAVFNCREARRVFECKLPVDVVFTDAFLPDGDWSDVIEAAGKNGIQAKVVVCTTLAHANLKPQVLERGGHDLLVTPSGFERVLRSLDAAATLRLAASAEARPT